MDSLPPQPNRLADSQGGLRKNRGYVDKIFTSRQLVEKTLEDDDSLFVLFIES